VVARVDLNMLAQRQTETEKQLIELREQRMICKNRVATRIQETSLNQNQTCSQSSPPTPMNNQTTNSHQTQPTQTYHKQHRMINTAQDAPMFHGDEEQDKEEPQMCLKSLRKDGDSGKPHMDLREKLRTRSMDRSMVPRSLLFLLP
jgi:hypothetical protein